MVQQGGTPGILDIAGHDLVHLDQGTFMWVQLVRFAIDPARSDADLLAALIASPGYRHDFLGPFDGEPDDRPVHGRWRLAAITPDRFGLLTRQEATATLRAWATDQHWTEPAYHPSPAALARVEDVTRLFEAGPVLALRNPGSEQEHDAGFALGTLGFHEFVVIDRDRSVAHLIVASDD